MKRLSPAGRRALWLSALLLLLVTVELAVSWPDRSLWYDETVNAYFSERSWPDIWEWCTEIDNQVPLHFVLLKLWGGAAGTGEFSLRAFSAGCAILSVAGVIALGRRIGGMPLAGWLAGLAYALCQGFLYAAFEVRTYALTLALFAWASVILWELCERYADERKPFSRRYWSLLIAYWLFALGLVYAHYTGFLVLAAHGAYVGGRALGSRSRRRALLLVHMGIGVAVGYVPWLLALAGRDIRAGTAYAGSIEPGDALQIYLDFYAHGQHVVPDDAPPYTTSLLVLVIAALPLWWLAHRRDRAAWGAVYAALLAVLPLAGLVVMVYAVQGKLSGRHGWPLWLGASLVIGLGLAALARLRWGRWPLWVAALLVIWMPATTGYQPIYNSYLREAFNYIDDRAEPGDTLVLRDGTLFTAAGYYDSAVPYIGLPPDKLTDVNRFLFFYEALDGLEELIEQNDARRVWVIAWQGHIMDPQDLVAGVLEYIGEAQPIERAFGDVFVSLYNLHDSPRALYERVMALEPIAQPVPDGPVYYGGYVLDQEPVPPGGILHLHTWWQRGDPVLRNMRVSIRFYGPDDTLYAQYDQPPVAWSFGQEHWQPGTPILSRHMLWVPHDVPPGPVEVRMIIYDMQGLFEPITVSIATVEVG
ncbi:MAG: hypothetical protein JXJ20_01200 [Anaerolineae bacterium]|nr:hypothetical protein [Anaerolineae bacterium]